MIRKSTYKLPTIGLLLLLAIATSSLLFGQARFSKSTVISAGEGIEGLEVYKIFTDNEQRLWINTDLAINIYDGYEVKILKKGITDNHLHSSNNVNSFIDRGDSVDIYYKNVSNFFDRWNKQTGLIDSITVEVPSPQDTIVQLLLSNTKEIWVLQKGDTAFYFYNTVTGKYIHSSYLKLVNDFSIKKISTGKEGFWLMDGTLNCYFFSYSSPSNQAQYAPPKQLTTYNPSINQLDHILQEDSLGNLWVSYPSKKGIFHKDRNSNRIEAVHDMPMG